MITFLIVWLIVMIPTSVISWIWVTMIDCMRRDHPDYEGLDLFDEEDKDHV